MPDVAEVDVVGLQSLLSQLDVKKYKAAFSTTLLAIGERLRDGVADYPPKTEANQPREPNTHYSIKTHRPINRWYERGKGTVTCSGKVYLTSQDLSGSWAVKVENLTVEVGSRVTYGPYVQGSWQVWFHKARGWKTIFQVVKEKTPAIVKMLAIVVDRLLASPPGGKK